MSMRGEPQNEAKQQSSGVSQQPPPPMVKSFASRLSNGYKISSSGAGVAILFFFLPWISVSCQGQSVGSFSGWDLAAGTTLKGSGPVDGMPSLFLVLLAGFAVLGLAFFATRRGYLNKLDGFGLICLGAIALIMMFWKVLGIKSQAAQNGITVAFTVDYQFGFWVALLGCTAVIVGGVMNLRELGTSLPELGGQVSNAFKRVGSPPRGSPPGHSNGTEEPSGAYSLLASIKETVALSPQRALDEAQSFLASLGYGDMQRIGHSLKAERYLPLGGGGQKTLHLTITATPQPGGGVRINVSGDDEDGMLQHQGAWKAWSENLPKRSESQPTRLASQRAAQTPSASRSQPPVAWTGRSENLPKEPPGAQSTHLGARQTKKGITPNISHSPPPVQWTAPSENLPKQPKAQTKRLGDQRARETSGVSHSQPLGESFDFCPKCGHKAQTAVNFCPKCGYDLHGQ